MAKNAAFYAVRVGRQCGVFRTWAECQQQVVGVSGAVFKRFRSEADAASYVGVASTSSGVVPPVDALRATVPDAQPTSTKPPAWFYAVAHGRRAGIFTTLADVHASVKGCDDAIHRKFRREADARAFLATHAAYEKASAAAATAPGPKKRGAATVSVFIDGSGAGRHGGGAGLYFGRGDARNLAVRIVDKAPTNNRAELIAALAAVELVPRKHPLCLHTDSAYVQRGLASRCYSCEAARAAGKTLLNADLWERMLRSVAKRRAAVTTVKVPAHHGVAGNECADLLAGRAAQRAQFRPAEVERLGGVPRVVWLSPPAGQWDPAKSEA